MIDKLVGKLSSQRRTRISLEVRETNLRGPDFLPRAAASGPSRVLRDFYDDSPEDAYLMQYLLPAGRSGDDPADEPHRSHGGVRQVRRREQADSSSISGRLSPDPDPASSSSQFDDRRLDCRQIEHRDRVRVRAIDGAGIDDQRFAAPIDRGHVRVAVADES